MTKKFEIIVLTPEEDGLASTAKSKLYAQNYNTIIDRMRAYDVKFPPDLYGTNEHGINASEFARWCGIKYRQTMYNNSHIKQMLAKHIKEIGIAGLPEKTVTDKKSEHDIVKQGKEINESRKSIASLSNQIDELAKENLKKDKLIEQLKAELAKSQSETHQRLAEHIEQVQNSILNGGRTF